MFIPIFFPIFLCLLTQLGNADANNTGCGKAVASDLKRGGVGQSNNVTFTTSSGVLRTLMLHIPTQYDVNTATPLIFSFHGRGESGVLQESKTRLSDESLNPNMIVVYPDGLNAQWQGDPAAVGYNDTGFVLDMITSFEDQFCIDSSRIYSSGFSNGAGFSLNQLACDPVASNKFAAFEGSSAAAYQGTTDVNCDPASVPIACKPGRILIPILESHGSADPVINYFGGPRRSRCLPSIPHLVTSWALHGGQGSTNTTISLYNGNVKKYQFGNTGLVTHYWINGMGHAWPWASQGSYIDFTPVVISFFNNFTLPVVAQAQASNSATSNTIKSSTTTSIGGSTTSSKSTSISTSSVSKPTNSVISSTASATAKASSSSTTGTSASTATPTCPASDSTIFTTAGGHKYVIHCATDSTSDPIQGWLCYPGSFPACMEQCDATTGCRSVSYNGACYLKGDPGSFVKKSTNVYRIAVRVS